MDVLRNLLQESPFYGLKSLEQVISKQVSDKEARKAAKEAEDQRRKEAKPPATEKVDHFLVKVGPDAL